MALREIVKEGYESLSKVCKPVTSFDARLKTMIDDMVDTVLDADGLGLAAPQIGIVKRAVVVVDSNGMVIPMINPVIIDKKGKQNPTEGCLSVPGIWGRTERPAVVTVKAQDVNGEWFTLTRDGITAVAICHELDHLEGVLFREHVVEYIDDDDK